MELGWEKMKKEVMMEVKIVEETGQGERAMKLKVEDDCGNGDDGDHCSNIHCCSMTHQSIPTQCDLYLSVKMVKLVMVTRQGHFWVTSFDTNKGSSCFEWRRLSS